MLIYYSNYSYFVSYIEHSYYIDTRILHQSSTMAQTKQTARKKTGGKKPRRQLYTKESKNLPQNQVVLVVENTHQSFLQN